MWPFIGSVCASAGSISISQLSHISSGSSCTQVCSENRTSLDLGCEIKATVVLSHWTPEGSAHPLVHLTIIIYNLTEYEFINCNTVLPVNIWKNNTFLKSCLVPWLTGLCTGTDWARCWQGLSLISRGQPRVYAASILWCCARAKLCNLQSTVRDKRTQPDLQLNFQISLGNLNLDCQLCACPISKTSCRFVGYIFYFW